MESPPPDLEWKPGDFIGRYEVVSFLGAGGMGCVLRCRDPLLKREVAVKVLKAAPVDQNRARFLREIEVMTRMSHPGVVRLLDYQVEEEPCFLVMPLYHGKDLEKRLQEIAADHRRPRSVHFPELLRIGIQIAEALEAVHPEGIIHRDIKPSNVMLLADPEQALLLDFGLARIESASQLTQARIVVGTPAYLSPEQLSGDTITARTDVFQLGLLLCFMFSGAPATDANSLEELVTKRLLGQYRRPRELLPLIPAPLEQVILDCLPLDAEDRVSDTELVRRLRDLAPLRCAPGSDGTPSGRRIARTSGRSSAPRLPETTAHRLSPALAVRGLFMLGMLVIGTLTLVALRPGREAPRTVSTPAPDSGAVRASVAVTVSVPSPSPRAGRPRTLRGRDGATLILIPGGTFTMGGAPGSERGLEPHRVTVSPFYMDQDEVTERLFARYVERAPPPAGAGRKAPGEGPDHPVTGVTWDQAQSYCQAWGRRLPTEAEWEFAVRGPEGRRYPWGNTLEGVVHRANLKESLEMGSDPYGKTSPVGSFPSGASPQGIRDLMGNVLEWCSDYYDERYYLSSPPSDPQGPATGVNRVLRGGSFRDPPGKVAAFARFNRSPGLAKDYIGFRCACDAGVRSPGSDLTGF